MFLRRQLTQAHTMQVAMAASLEKWIYSKTDGEMGWSRVNERGIVFSIADVFCVVSLWNYTDYLQKINFYVGVFCPAGAGQCNG